MKAQRLRCRIVAIFAAVHVGQFGTATGAVPQDFNPNEVDFTPDEVGRILATNAVAVKECSIKISNNALNLAVAKLGQDLVDFLPAGRYAPLVNLKLKKVSEWVSAEGKTKACSGMVEMLKKYLPDVYH